MGDIGLVGIGLKKFNLVLRKRNQIIRVGVGLYTRLCDLDSSCAKNDEYRIHSS